MVSAPFFALSYILTASLVRAHGYVDTVAIDGRAYQGWHPFVDNYIHEAKSIVRRIPDDGPVYNISSPALACNEGGEAGAGLIASARGGSVVTFRWNRWPEDHKGPVTTYMADCNGNCSVFGVGSRDRIWFKIDEAGLFPNGVWASNALTANNGTWSIIIPATIKPGQYLIRHEILALHSIREPQVYPSCTQVNVRESFGSDVPLDGELASIPGIYDDAGDAIYGDIWNQPTSWPIVGPPVVRFAARFNEAKRHGKPMIQHYLNNQSSGPDLPKAPVYPIPASSIPSPTPLSPKTSLTPSTRSLRASDSTNVMKVGRKGGVTPKMVRKTRPRFQAEKPKQVETNKAGITDERLHYHPWFAYRRVNN
ncbi:glycoside hydrolase family 61 protein [Botryobasidium botryosum FD-172 SS1]|uniref:lytic cellulose monooxygenase (C4-dehydrogenating) n=1 Tax=Botryobasidium botryosum (strain FD-172 SS1) TaxID=930990 RepID=A0A067MJE3_BOTB1|nr:glycoside hydrolase family 61 protein [Botryobasidium botryosum FD-172 SS1]